MKASGMSLAIYTNFLGQSPNWYKLTIIAFLFINPLVFINQPYIAGWLLVIEFIFTLAMALKCYPLQPGGLLALQAIAMGIEHRAAAQGQFERLALAPGKQPDAGTLLVIGAAGGPTIPVTVARAIIGVLDFKLGAQDALAMPFAMSFGDMLLIEEGTALAAMKDDFAARGYGSIRVGPAPIKANALGRRADGTWEVATEPRLASVVTP